MPLGDRLDIQPERLTTYAEAGVTPVKGAWVRLVGLVGRPELNGFDAEVITDVQGERYGVRVVRDGAEEKLLVKPKNFQMKEEGPATSGQLKIASRGGLSLIHI